MYQPDPTRLPSERTQPLIISATAQTVGEVTRQEDYIGIYRDECFVLADGVSTSTHGNVAAALASETALWAFKLIRQRPFYWQDKRLFIKRIFRSVNMTVWQKRREPKFTDGLETTLIVFIMGWHNFWLGSVGDTAAYLVREGIIEPLVIPDIDTSGSLTKALGVQRFGLIPQFATGVLVHGDMIILATDGVTKYIDEIQFRELVENAGITTESLNKTAEALIAAAQKNGSTENGSVVIVKRLDPRLLDELT